MKEGWGDKMQKIITTIMIGAVLLFLANASFYTVDQRQYALVFQFGAIVRVDDHAGFKFKVPFLQTVRFYDRRILTDDPKNPDYFNTREKQNVEVDSYVKWQIADVDAYYKATGGADDLAALRLRQIINSNLRDEIGNRTVSDVITGKREQIMKAVLKRANAEAEKLGVKVLDVRLKRVDFPQAISDAVYERMNSERKQVANKLRSEGGAEAEAIRADADREKEVIRAQAYEKAEKIRGEGDAEAASIYAQAFGANPEFYAFYKSMDAYQKTFRNKSDVMVLDPSSDFFKYLKQPGTGKAAK